MSEATITFKREDREGLIPAGTYLSDAAARFGIRFEGKCSPSEHLHFCRVDVTDGADNLSRRTAEEVEVLKDAGENFRLACQTKITQPGEITIMTEEPKVTETAEPEKNGHEEAAKEYSKQFAELPLEKKFAELVQLEAIALGETFSFILNSPYLVFDKVLDVMAEFGLRKEHADRTAARPAEHSAEPVTEAADNEEAKVEEPPATEPEGSST